MRILLNIKTLQQGVNTIPVNYSYPLSAWIYHTIADGNHEFAKFLHDTGFITGNRQYKLFTFSDLRFPPKGFKVEGDRLHILNGECRLTLSFQAPQALENFVMGLFRGQEFSIGDRTSQTRFKVETVELQPLPAFGDTAKFRCLSPILVSKERPNSRNAEYLEPDHPDFGKILSDNLINKLTAAISGGLLDAQARMAEQEVNIKIRLLNTPKSRLMVIKAGTPQQTKIKGYTFDFEIKAPSELIKIGYNAGFGEKNALGLGCVQTI